MYMDNQSKSNKPENSNIVAKIVKSSSNNTLSVCHADGGYLIGIARVEPGYKVAKGRIKSVAVRLYFGSGKWETTAWLNKIKSSGLALNNSKGEVIGYASPTALISVIRGKLKECFVFKPYSKKQSSGGEV